jgi:hypothetical protein
LLLILVASGVVLAFIHARSRSFELRRIVRLGSNDRDNRRAGPAGAEHPADAGADPALTRLP